MSSSAGRHYSGVRGHYDETAQGSAHWQRLNEALAALGPREFEHRWAEGQRLIREHGVTYNVYGDPRGAERPWQLDPIPFLISSSEWQSIAAAVSQRAMLLNSMLGDLYGPGRLLRERLLPAALTFANPGFLRPCHGLPVANDSYLHVYAADLARAPDGQWWVIADRTQAPSGLGYALENRVVVSRILPEGFRGFHVERLASYFRAYIESLNRLAPWTDSPHIVLLTPGPYNETYFEHAYLARYLGVTLAEGADLTVRDDRVYLKTLPGLLPVDVILRRQDDAFCDPLELFGESALGVAGLVQAVRAGKVAIANALGSGVLETAATMAFLPALCRDLLGEELRMPSVATWWCGHERERAYVRNNLKHLVVKPTFSGAAREVIFGSQLTQAKAAELQAAIDAAPHLYTAQEQVALSTVPTAVEGGTDSRHMVLRVYAVAGENGFEVMPGGLTRVSSSADSLVVSIQRGGGSKDTWVLADEPVPYASLLGDAVDALEVSRSSFALTSRIADDLLWLGRMSERVEAGTRSFRCALRSLAEDPIRSADAEIPDAVVLLARLGWLGREQEPVAGGEEEQILEALFDRARLGALGGEVGQLQSIAWRLRDRISSDAWRVLQRLDASFKPSGTHPALRVSAAIDLLDSTLTQLAAFTGLVMESMTRELGWQFLDIGRRIERALRAVELLQHGLVEGAPGTSRRLENVLEIADSAMTYRSRYRTTLHPRLILDLLLLDEANPRAVAFQLVSLCERFEHLERSPKAQAAELVARLRSTDLDDLLRTGSAAGGPRRSELETLLEELTSQVPSLADALSHAYLSHVVPTRQPAGVRKRE